MHNVKIIQYSKYCIIQTFFSRTYGPTAVWKEQVFHYDHVAGTILEQKILIIIVVKAQGLEINIGD